MEFDDAPFQLVPCNICGRKFKDDRFAKHYEICSKTASKKRKVFDSSKQRAEGTEIKSVKPAPARSRVPQRSQIPAKKSGWREKHEEFIRTIRHAKLVSQAEEAGTALPPPPPPAANPDYVTCEYCNRRFNEHAAERHIPFCREQAARLPKTNANAKARLNVRTKYQPPAPKVRNGGMAATVSGSDMSSRSGASGARTQAGSGYGRQQNGYQPSRYAAGDRRDSSGSGTGMMPSNGKSLRTGKSQQQYLAYKEEHLRDSPSGTSYRSQGGGGSGGSNGRTRSGSGHRALERVPSCDSLNNQYSSAARNTNTRFGFNSGKPPINNNPSHLDSLAAGKQRNGSAGLSKFCHECGNKHPIPTARFCCMCGVRRMTIAN